MAKKTDEKFKNLESQLKRALADYANLARHSSEEKERVVKFANVILIAKLLEVLDGLEAAQKAHPSEGLELIVKKFKDILASENVKEIAETQVEFDPELHEGIGVVEGDTENQVAEVLQKGYEISGKVIRPARVKVTKKKVG